MKVGIVTHYWLPHRGGVEVMALEQAERLCARGHDVVVVTSAIAEHSGEVVQTFGAGTLRVRRHAASDVLGRRGVPWPVPSPALVRAWVKLAAECDVILVHGCTYAHSPTVIAAARRRRTPVLLLQSNPHVDYPGIVDRVERLVDNTLGRWCCERADRVASISAYTASHVARIAPRSRHDDIVYIGVDHHRFRPPTCEERTRARTALGYREPMVLTVRRLVARNGVEWAIRMWIDGGLDDSGEFVIVGDGPQRAELEAIARGHNIRFLGAVDDGRLVDAFRAADVFVMPTRSGEGFGLAAAEAMACGIPVVASGGGALEEVVAHGVTGSVIDVDDAVAFGRSIRHLLADDDARTLAGAAARSRVEHLFTWDRCVDELEALLSALCHQPSRTAVVAGKAVRT